jgi:hypothetical protein
MKLQKKTIEKVKKYFDEKNDKSDKGRVKQTKPSARPDK